MRLKYYKARTNEERSSGACLAMKSQSSLRKGGLVFVEHARCGRVVVPGAGYVPLTPHNIAQQFSYINKRDASVCTTRTSPSYYPARNGRKIYLSQFIVPANNKVSA